MTILYFDVETLPARDEKIAFLRRLHEEKLAKEADKAIKNTPADFDTYFRSTALSGAHGQVFCTSMIKERDGVEIGRTTLCGEEEKELLKKFWGICRDVNLYVGHNIRSFDLRFLIQRSIINNISYPSISLKRYSDYPVFDTQDQWMMYEGFISLHELAHALDIPSPKDGGIDGSQVYDFYLAGKHQEIQDYCMRDVDTVRAVYKRLTGETKKIDWKPSQQEIQS